MSGRPARPGRIVSTVLALMVTWGILLLAIALVAVGLGWIR